MSRWINKTRNSVRNKPSMPTTEKTGIQSVKSNAAGRSVVDISQTGKLEAYPMIMLQKDR